MSYYLSYFQECNFKYISSNLFSGKKFCIVMNNVPMVRLAVVAIDAKTNPEELCEENNQIDQKEKETKLNSTICLTQKDGFRYRSQAFFFVISARKAFLIFYLCYKFCSLYSAFLFSQSVCIQLYYSFCCLTAQICLVMIRRNYGSSLYLLCCFQ